MSHCAKLQQADLMHACTALTTFAALAVLQQAGAASHLLFACLALHCALLAAEPQSLQTKFGAAFVSLPAANCTTGS